MSRAKEQEPIASKAQTRAQLKADSLVNEESSGVVAIIGRPNVGKSTLVNRMVGRRVAIVEERPGVTRDRLELKAEWRGRNFVVVDTGGMLEHGDALEIKVTKQALRALDGADVVLFVLDATTGLTVQDDAVATILRRRSKNVVVVANKVDSDRLESDAWELARLGFGDPKAVSALHGRGVGDLLDAVVDRLEAVRDARTATSMAPIDVDGDEHNEHRVFEPTFDTKAIASVAIVGRPNVGKSTLFNRLVGDERSVVHHVAGTTRDAIDTVVENEGDVLRFIDTAGLRRKSKFEDGTEYYSLVRSLSAIDRANVALLVIDAGQGVTHQDQRLAERVDAAGSPIVVVLNKWDLCTTEQRLGVANEVEDRLGFIGYAPVLRISALTGLGVSRLIPAIRLAVEAYHQRIPTGQLNDALKAIQAAHPAPGAKILYGVQGAVEPPTFTLFATRRLHPSYLRYVEHFLRERFDFGPTPLKLRVRMRGS